MRGFVWFVLIISSLMLMVLIPLAMLMSVLSNTVLKPYNVTNYVEAGRIDTTLHHIILKQLSESEITEDSEDMDEEDILFRTVIQQSIEQVVTPDWIKTKLEILQTELWDILLGKKDVIEPISIHDLHDAVVTNYSKLKSSNARMVMMNKNNQVGQMDELIAKIPEKLNVMEVYKVEPGNLTQLRDRYQFINQVIHTTYIAVILLSLLGLLLAYYPTALLRWLGFTVGFISGGFLLLVDWVKEKDVLHKLREQPQSEVWSDLQRSALAIGGRLKLELTDYVIQWGYILLIGSVIFLILSYLPTVKRFDAYARDRWGGRKSVGFRLSGILIIIAILTWQSYALVGDLSRL